MLQTGPENQVVGHFTDQQIATIRLRPRITPIDRHAGHTGEEPARLASLGRTGNQALAPKPRPQLSPGLDRAATEQPSLLASGNDVDRRSRTGQELVSSQVAVVVGDHLSRDAVLANELAAPVIQTHPVLTTTAG